jgi:hypothetical protein
MIGITTRLLYVQSAGDEESFAWYGGKVLTADQHAERAQIHYELTEIVKGAESDESAEWGRAVRCGERLLVEVELDRPAGAGRRRIATIVISVARPDADWPSQTADEIAALLREGGFNVAVDRLARALANGWSRKRPLGLQRMNRVRAAEGAALVLAMWWVLRMARIRRRRQVGPPRRRPRSRRAAAMDQR